MNTPNWPRFSGPIAALLLSAALMAGCRATQPTASSPSDSTTASMARVETESDGERETDMEPVDPAEQRPAVLPPARPVSRGGGTWLALGPSPTQSAQVDVPPDDEVTGAIQAIAAHPTNADILYIGAVNGGIWRTANATAARPTWTPLTDALPSQSIGALAFDPLDATRQTLIAGTGRFSNFAQRGDDEIGVYRTTNGGASWSVHGGATLLGQKLIAVAARGPRLFAASTTGGLFRSDNSGATFALASGSGNLPTGGILDLVGNSTNTNQFYIATRGSAPKVLRSDDGGLTWNDVTTGIPSLGSTTGAIRIAVGASGVVYLAVVNSGVLAAVVRSTNLGGTWTAMDVPSVHPGAQGTVNTSIAADPANANIVYIAGDRITASPFTGNVVRGDASLAAGSQFAITHGSGGGSTSPHADSRAMAFDANGNLLQSDDGGIYRRTAPTSSAGTWGSVIGNLAITEVHDLAHDRVANVIMIGTQDNGTHQQQTAADPRWTMINGGDGGDAAIDDDTLGIAGSYRYISSQNSGGFRRARYSAANAFVSNQSLPAIADPQFVTPVELNVVNPARMLLGGVNTIYESTNITTGTPTFTSLGAPGANRNAMAYGASDNPDAAYVGKNAAVFRRQANAFVATTALPAGAAAITDVAMDPHDSQRVYAVDDNQVFVSTNAGATWQDITGNLGTISSFDFRTIEFIPGNVDGVALGTRSGVYYATVGSTTWGLLGSGIPDVLVFDLRYIESSGQLIAGTLGRGVWSLALDTDRIFANGFQ